MVNKHMKLKNFHFAHDEKKIFFRNVQVLKILGFFIWDRFKGRNEWIHTKNNYSRKSPIPFYGLIISTCYFYGTSFFLCEWESKIFTFYALAVDCIILNGLYSMNCYDNPQALETHLLEELKITRTQYNLLCSIISFPNIIFSFSFITDYFLGDISDFGSGLICILSIYFQLFLDVDRTINIWLGNRYTICCWELFGELLVWRGKSGFCDSIVYNNVWDRKYNGYICDFKTSGIFSKSLFSSKIWSDLVDIFAAFAFCDVVGWSEEWETRESFWKINNGNFFKAKFLRRAQG